MQLGIARATLDGSSVIILTPIAWRITCVCLFIEKVYATQSSENLPTLTTDFEGV